MTKLVEVSSFLEEARDVPLLDIRSPSEYGCGHIPRAISFSLFSDKERNEVGVIYKTKGRRAAFKVGLEIVGPKMLHFVERVERLHAKHLAIYCWRGGMRSESMAWLLRQAGFEINRLRGGYKAYRALQRQFFKQPHSLRIISGYTGSQKTRLLQMIKMLGGQVIDLEALANHQGSSFGNVKTNGQPTTEQFQNLIFDAFRKFDLSKPIFMEDECFRIGEVHLPEDLHRQKERSPHILIQTRKSDRINSLVQDYGHLPIEKLIEATQGIARRLGGLRTKRAIKHIENNELHAAASLILEYYDKQYEKSLRRKSELVVQTYVCEIKQMEDLARQIIGSTTNIEAIH